MTTKRTEFWRERAVRFKDALKAAEAEVERLTYELKRWKEVDAQRPDWEKLWAEQTERAEAAEAEVERLRKELSDYKMSAGSRGFVLRAEAEAEVERWKAGHAALTVKWNELDAEVEKLKAALEQIAYLDSPQVRGLPRRRSIHDIARAALEGRSRGMTVAELIELLQQQPETAQVLREDSDYRGAVQPVRQVEYYAETTLANAGNTVVIR